MTKQQLACRRWHLNAVMAWGYTLAEAFALCKAYNWFGDTGAQTTTATN